MKTTIDLTDGTLLEAKRVAEREGTTLRALVEEGLRHVLATHRTKRSRFRLRRATFKGDGVSPEFEAADWPATRDAIYRGHGA